MAMLQTASAGLTPQYQQYFDRQLLSYAKPLIVTAQFAQKRPFPKNKGATSIRFFRPDVPDRTRVAALTEGIPLAQFRDITYTPVNVTLAQYGEAIKITDIVSFTDLFSTLDQGVRLMGEDAGVHADFLCVQQVATLGSPGSANRYYGSATSTPFGRYSSYANLQGATNAEGKMKIVDLLWPFARLTITKAKKPEGAAYATIIHPQQAYDVMQDAKFVDVGTKREGNTVAGNSIFNGEIGTWYGNRIMVTTEGWSENAAEGTYDGAITNASVYTAMVLGREALGAAIMAGQSPFSPSIIVNNGADSGNPLKQFITAGWKAYWATVLLNDLWAVTVRTASTYIDAT